MTASMNDIVDINISATTSGVKEEGFGIPLIADYHTVFSERIRFYSSLAEMVTDGFATTSAAYRAAAACFAQSPEVNQLAIGRRANAPDLTINLYPTAVNSKAYSVDVNGETATHTSDSSATVAEITAGLTAAINALSISGLTASDQTTYVRIKASSAGTFFSAVPADISLLSVRQEHTDPGIAADLDAIVLEDNSWYGLMLTTSGAAEVEAASDWAETAKKLMVQTTQDGRIPTSSTSDIATTLVANTRTALMHHADNGEFADAAFLGKIMPSIPGAATFKFKQLATVNSMNYTTSQLNYIKAKNCNYLTSFGGNSAITAEGVTTSGEFIDNIRNRDWLESRIRSRVYGALINAQKIPYTDKGIAALGSEVSAALQEAVDAGYLSSYTLTLPKASAAATVDKAARHLRGISFVGYIAGAIHKATITGVVTL